MSDSKKTKILIVEDEELIRKAYAEELRDEGYSMFVASNGKDGLEIALKEKPDLILLDILMPIMDGVAMMSELREKNHYGETVPIILLTNLSTNEERVLESIAKYNPAYYLDKSNWELKQVVEKIHECLAAKNL